MINNLLPSLLGDELIHEPFEQDGFLTECSHTRITGLELPRIGYTIADDGDVKDTEEGKEMAVRGDKVGFGRHKTLIYADVSESVLQGSAFDVESYVDQALDAGMRKKAKRRIFATTPKSGEEHMSVYDETTVGVKTIEYDPTSDTLIEAVITALADLGDEYADKAKVAMRRVDYYKAIKELAMGADTLWGAKPEDVIGAPVVFCENASYPIVGDLSTIHINDDIAAARTVVDNPQQVHIFPDNLRDIAAAQRRHIELAAGLFLSLCALLRRVIVPGSVWMQRARSRGSALARLFAIPGPLKDVETLLQARQTLLLLLNHLQVRSRIATQARDRIALLLNLCAQLRQLLVHRVQSRLGSRVFVKVTRAGLTRENRGESHICLKKIFHFLIPPVIVLRPQRSARPLP